MMTLLLSLVLAVATAYKTADVNSNAGLDSASLLQKPSGKEGNSSASTGPAPHIIGLRRESVPIYRRGKIASFKTSYSGVLSVGYPPQDFRVVFDTGSAHIILPAVECKSEACLANNRRHYDQTKSTSSLPINADGSIVHEGDSGEQVTIGFGTGDITGEFAKDTVCFGKGQTKDEMLHLKQEQRRQEEIAALIKQESLLIHDYQDADAQVSSSDGTEVVADHSPMCMEMSMIVAIEMSTVPFKTFKFDGILGLSLDGLAMNRNFSTFDMLVRNGLASQPHFGVFLTDSEDLEPSEVAFGGADQHRMLEPLTWSHVYRPDLGYWVVPITAVRVDGVELDVCKDGTCRGVVDTGTSHLGVPGPFDKELADMLRVDAGDLLDCRLAKSPKLEIDLEGGKTIDLFASSYMRRLPLREGVTVSSEKGVTLDDKDDKKDKKKEASFQRPGYVPMYFGSGRSSTKCIRQRARKVRCPAEAANLRDDIYGDRFQVYHRGDEICVNRTDQDGGWGMDLKFYCPEPWVADKEGEAQPGMEAIYLGELDPNEEKCYNTFSELSCQSSREFTVRTAEHKKICVTRKDVQVTEATDVLRCKMRVDEALIGLEEVVIGPNEGQQDMPKCVTPLKEVICDKEAGNRRKDNFPDSFEIFQQDGQICATRLDAGQSSWALNLIIHCRPKDEPEAEVRTIDRDDVHLQQGPTDPPATQEEAPLPEKIVRHCSPRLMAVNLPAPLGPKLFILGEPVLHRYYTVYDWEEKRVGFALANTQRNTMDMSTLGRGSLPKEVDMLLMQRHMEVKPPAIRP